MVFTALFFKVFFFKENHQDLSQQIKPPEVEKFGELKKLGNKS